MKSSISVLRTTTAIMVSLSLAGTHALAAGGGVTGMQLAQTTVDQPETVPLTAEERKAARQQAAEERKAARQQAAEERKEARQQAQQEAQQETEPQAAEEETVEQEAQTEAAEQQAVEEPGDARAQAAEERREAREQAAEERREAREQAAEERRAAQQEAIEQQAAEEAEREAAEQQETQLQATEQQATEQQDATEPRDARQQAAEERREARQQAAEERREARQEAVEERREARQERIEEATATGQDVVAQDETTSDELEAELERLRNQQVDLETRLDEALDTESEVITDATSRSANEEALIRDDDDDSDVWKYLGAAAAGAAVGALVPALGGRLVQDQGDRMIVERGGEFFIRGDENMLLRQPGATVQTEEFPGGITRTSVLREDGSEIVTIRNEGGFILRRTRITPDGQEIVLLEQTPEEVYSFEEWDDTLSQVTAHQAPTIDYARSDREDLRQAFFARPGYEFERAFPLQAVRESERVRELVPAVDLPINFATGSAAIQRSEIDELTQLGRMMEDIIDENPREIFLVEGHTDAVGSNLINLTLSDRRAEAVALALTEYFDVPPENLVVQGYGERHLKEPIEGPSGANRRATVRRITPLIDQVAAR